MATYAILDNGSKVENIIMVTPSVAATHYPAAIEIDSIVPMPGIGWSYFKGVFTPPAH